MAPHVSHVHHSLLKYAGAGNLGPTGTRRLRIRWNPWRGKLRPGEGTKGPRDRALGPPWLRFSIGFWVFEGESVFYLFIYSPCYKSFSENEKKLIIIK